MTRIGKKCPESARKVWKNKTVTPITAGTHVMVVGDVMLDQYIFGTTHRLSPEAPVPVVLFDRKEETLGGAGNVALNLLNLGLSPMLCSMVGNDQDGLKISKIIKQHSLPLCALYQVAYMTTTKKTRIIGQNQQIVRIDHEQQLQTINWDRSELNHFYAGISASLEDADAIVISDYGKGVVTPDLIEFILSAKKNKTKVICDSKTKNLAHCKQAHCITPNRKEAEDYCGFQIDSMSTLHKAFDVFLETINPKITIITLGSQGIAYRIRNDRHMPPTIIPTQPRTAYDVTGAGDVVTAVMTYATLTGMSVLEGVKLANWAGSIVVGRIGTSRISLKEIMKGRKEERKIIK